MTKLFLALIFITSLITLPSSASANQSAVNTTDISLLKNYPHRNNKVAKLLDSYRKLGKIGQHISRQYKETYAENMMSWQLPTGGYGIQNHNAYLQPWDGQQERSQFVSKGIEHGNFDDDATVAEIRFLAKIYNDSKKQVLKTAIKTSVAKALQFVFVAQHPSGGWPQVYPKRQSKKGKYSNHITLNDNAMIRVMVLLSDMAAGIAPFDSDLIAAQDKDAISTKLQAAVHFLLKAQIKTKGQLTIWSAQHNPLTYQAESGRKYEPVALTGHESAGVVAYLMNWPKQTADVQNAINAAVSWYQDNKLNDLWHNKKTGIIDNKQGKRFWYRFYDVNKDTPFFCGRDGVKKYQLSEIDWERRTSYGWGGDYAGHILKAYKHYINNLTAK